MFWQSQPGSLTAAIKETISLPMPEHNHINDLVDSEGFLRGTVAVGFIKAQSMTSIYEQGSVNLYVTMD